jgi:flavin reductase (DIM6/NTAB) family NADH-FMN oxidoreductase RutF
MTQDASYLPGEILRQTMRRWPTGVSIVACQYEGRRHGMTVNSFTSISLDPPLVTVTLANDTRTHALVQAAGFFRITVLASDQQHLSDIFAGKVADHQDRFAGVELLELAGNMPLIRGGLAALVCRVFATHPFPHSTLFIGEVTAAWHRDDGGPLVYMNRGYHRLELETPNS